MARFHSLTVTDIRRETRDAVVLTLCPAAGEEDEFRFIQGQYLTLRSVIDGEEVRRSYSICAGVQDGALRVGIKRVAGGLFSSWANEHLKRGDLIDAMPPMGNFFVPLDAANRKHYVGFASGSGITPLISIIKTTLHQEPHSSFTLFFGNRASSTIMFREELEDLKSRHMTRFSLVHVLSREQQDVELLNGRLSREKCDQLLGRWLDAADIDTAFICGPQEMMMAISESLHAHGVDRRAIKFELFAASEPRDRTRHAATVERQTRADLCQATVIMDGRAQSIELPKGGISLLDAGLQQGIELPYACKAGVCSTCRAMLVAGEVDMDANFSLEDYEVARGYILTCQSYPVTDTITVDYDK